jgi:leader peptidase (prepilin peptidase) / N-methyltransferase
MIVDFLAILLHNKSMSLLFYGFVFAFGCLIGSFLNVIIDRIQTEESVMKGRSHCDHCRHKLNWFDLVPVISFLFLKGKCRYCKKKISKYNPCIEILTGFSFVTVVLLIINLQTYLLVDSRYLLTIFYFLCIISCLITIFFIDLKFGIIPFTIVFFAIILTIFWHLLLPVFHFSSNEISFLNLNNTSLLNYFLSGLGVFIFFFLIFFFTKGKGMGFGDVVYVFFMGYLIGYPKIILGLYITFLTGAFISLLLILLRKKKFKGGVIPFGPFLVFGTVVSLFWGNIIIEKIINYFLGI